MLGQEAGLNLQPDLQWLQTLPHAEIQVLKQPSRQLFTEQLWEKPWDIFFFAGHSGCQVPDQVGQIHLNATDSLSFTELSHGIKRAIAQGLTLAILNSCDGLDLAQQLGQLHLPYAVVMREPVPDAIAQHFLRYFLTALTQGQTLHGAMRMAQEKLQGLEDQFPSASWLPVLCQNPAAPNWSWPQHETEAVQAVQSQAVQSQAVQSLHWKPWGMGGLLLGGLVSAIAVFFSLPKSPVSPPPENRWRDLKEIEVPSGIFNYGGSTTWAPIRGIADLEIQKQHPEFRLNYVHPGQIPSTVAGFELLKQRKIAFLQASRLLNADKLRRQGLTVKSIKVAQSFKVVAVHPSLQLPDAELTVSQMKDICSGKIRNWRSLGGPDLPIQLIDRDTRTNTMEAEPSSGDDCNGGNVKIVETPQEALQVLSLSPGGFYINTAALLVPQCSVRVLTVVTLRGDRLSPYQDPVIPPEKCPAQRNRVNLDLFRSGAYPPELMDILYVVVDQDGPPDQRAAGEAYARLLQTREGRALIEKAGFVPTD